MIKEHDFKQDPDVTPGDILDDVDVPSGHQMLFRTYNAFQAVSTDPASELSVIDNAFVCVCELTCTRAGSTFEVEAFLVPEGWEVMENGTIRASTIRRIGVFSVKVVDTSDLEDMLYTYRQDLVRRAGPHAGLGMDLTLDRILTSLPAPVRWVADDA